MKAGNHTHGLRAFEGIREVFGAVRRNRRTFSTQPPGPARKFRQPPHPGYPGAHDQADEGEAGSAFLPRGRGAVQPVYRGLTS